MLLFSWSWLKMAFFCCWFKCWKLGGTRIESKEWDCEHFTATAISKRSIFTVAVVEACKHGGNLLLLLHELLVVGRRWVVDVVAVVVAIGRMMLLAILLKLLKHELLLLDREKLYELFLLLLVEVVEVADVVRIEIGVNVWYHLHQVHLRWNHRRTLHLLLSWHLILLRRHLVWAFDAIRHWAEKFVQIVTVLVLRVLVY